MCTSGIMYEPEEDDEQVEVADEVKERVCNYSGLLSVREYQLISDNDD
jgi:hypothetical protein